MVTITATFDEVTKQWKVPASRGSNNANKVVLENFLNRDVPSGIEKVVLRLSYAPRSHAVRYDITASSPRLLTLRATNYKDCVVTIAGSLATLVEQVSSKSRVFIEALIYSKDGKLYRNPPRRIPVAHPDVPPTPATIQPNLPGFP